MALNDDGTAKLVFISYNMHGYNQGIVAIQHLIDTVAPAALLVQEHWLTPANLTRLDNISSLYFWYGSSAMSVAVGEGPVYGRPFGGTAILIKKQLAPLTSLIVTNDRYTAIKLCNWLLITVYLPCDGTKDRLLIYEEIMFELSAIRIQYDNCKCIIAGDFNTDLDSTCSITNIINAFIVEHNLYRCEKLFNVGQKCTYVNEHLNHASTVDYCLCSDSSAVLAFNVLDPDLNLSDHLPLLCICIEKSNFLNNVDKIQNTNEKSQTQQLRWDRADLRGYYNLTGELLQGIYGKICLLHDANLMDACYYGDNIYEVIDELYNNLVGILDYCANVCVPKRQKIFYKFWWDQNLNLLKENSTQSCKLWKDMGKPRSGPIFDKYYSDKMRYKRCIRESKQSEIHSYSNELHDALLKKNNTEFWKSWKSKFGCKRSFPLQVDGSNDHLDIAGKFASHFSNVCMPVSTEHNESCRSEYMLARKNYVGSIEAKEESVDVELVDNIICDLKPGKACGIDNLMGEHLQYSHPILCSILSKMFKLCIKCRHIPEAFGTSYTVPIPKGNNRTIASVSDFRGISISPVISKVFENCLLKIYGNFLYSSPNQFGFKKGLGCTHAIYTLQTVVNHYVTNGSTVNLCTLDLSKAFDKMNHYALLMALMKRNVPLNFLLILEKWFCISVTCVKWINVFSEMFSLRAGVRQGGILSPIFLQFF